MLKLMFHDDDCGELLDRDGRCPVCEFHPDMQSTGFRDVEDQEIAALRTRGRSFLGLYREPV